MAKARLLLRAGLIAALGIFVGVVHAEDIDIYAAPNNAADNPNVLIVVDSSANWNRNDQAWPGGIKQGQAELNAIRTVIDELGADVNVGVFLLTEGTGSGNENGGYVRFDIRPMDAINKAALKELIGNPVGCTDGANSLNATPNCIYKNFSSNAEQVGSGKANYSHALFDIFKYFGGFTSPANANTNTAGDPVDRTHFGTARFSGNPDTKSDRDAYVNGATDANKTNYLPPIGDGVSCAKNYIIFIGNGFPSADSTAALLSGVGGNTAKLSLPNFAITSVSVEELIATTACGTYTDTAACQTSAATDYPGYASYRCETANTCSAGQSTSTTTSLGVSACGAYATAAACQADLAATNGAAYNSYSCAVTGPACEYTQSLNVPVVVDNQATCIPNATQESACIAWASTNRPAYTGFSCTNAIKSSCSGNDRKWIVTASDQKFSGNTYAKTGTTTTLATLASDSHRVFGSRNVSTLTPTGTSFVPSDTDNNWADEWARFLFQTDVSAADGKQNIRTYAIDVIRRYTNPKDDDQTQLLLSMAQAGGGKYFNARDEDQIKNALRRIFAEIQSVSSVFASSSLPVSVNTQGTYLNQVFIGMFRPDGSALPRWAGNLKQYQLKFFGSALALADKDGNRAVSASTGFIEPCANSLWSLDSGTYWNYEGSLAVGSCTAETSSYPVAGSPSTYSDAPDGDIVEKGGAAQKLRGSKIDGGLLVTSTRYALCGTGESPATHACRNLKTCDSSACTSLVDFTTANTGLNSDLVDWVRGKDVDNENRNFDGGGVAITNEVRPSVHGGVVHSQPAVVDYGGTTGVVAYYGSDDGVFHAVDGGKTDGEGQELWGFVARESFGKLNRLRDNGTTTALISFPGITGAVAPKDYFFDGSIGVHQKDANVWIFPTMRRGGRAIYAFNVSNPAQPSLMWRKGCYTASTSTSDDVSCDGSGAGNLSDWSSIGQTWSKPQIAYLPGYEAAGEKYPVLVFGGGYDQCEDTDSQNRCTNPRKGAGIWFVDAATGTVLRRYVTEYSVPGDVFLMNDLNGNLKYVYAGDTNGNLYRINVGTTNATGTSFTDWTSNAASADIRVAALSTNEYKRKFLFGPDVFEFLGKNYIAIGSGDREHPLFDQYACADDRSIDGAYNRFFIVKDDPLLAQSGAGTSDIEVADLEDISVGTASAIDDVQLKGWQLSLSQCEQVVNKAVTSGGKVFFGTNQPTGTTQACVSNLGIARSWSIEIFSGESGFTEYAWGGLPPSPVTGIVDIEGVGKTPFCLGCGGPPPSPDDGCPPGLSPLDGKCVEVKPPPTRSRIFWYLQGD